MKPRFLFVEQVDVSHKIVLLRLDLNVPVKHGLITDDTRLQRVLPGIVALRAAKASIVILTHFGRPMGKVVNEFSVAPVAAALSAKLGCEVPVETEFICNTGQLAIGRLGAGDVLMMENLRFHPGEEANDADFAAALAKLGDIYVGDAFSCAHRAHASVDALPLQMAAAGKTVCAGRSMGTELAALEAALSNPKRPVIAIVGGSKVSTKLKILENLVTRVDGIVLGGGMANTFLLAMGHNVGASLVEADMVETVSNIMAAATSNDCRLILPIDALVACEFAVGAPHRVAAIEALSDNEMILDVGPASISAITDFLSTCKTVVWNGPIGAFEFPPFDKGTTAVARAVAARTMSGVVLSVAGGGDTIAALAKAGSCDQLSYVSTAGGAFLEWLEGKTLPGVEALRTDR